jgi:hypothetical protein
MRTTGPYPTNMRRNVTQGVPGLGIWYMTGAPSEPERLERNACRAVLADRPQRRGRASRRSATSPTSRAARDAERCSRTRFNTPVNWYQFCFLMGNGFGSGGDFSPQGKLALRPRCARMLEENAKLGYGDYRAPPILQDDVAEQYSFNDHVLRRFQRDAEGRTSIRTASSRRDAPASGRRRSGTCGER